MQTSTPPVSMPLSASVPVVSPYHPPTADSIWTLVGWTVLLAGGLLGCFHTPSSLVTQPVETVLEFQLESPSEPVDNAAPKQTLDPVPPESSTSLAIPLPAPMPASAVPADFPQAVIQSLAIPAAQPSPASVLESPERVSLERVDRSKEAGQETGVLPRAQASPGVPAPPAKEKLTFGVGEGRQPRPEYPATARGRRQQGTVILELWVDSGGRVGEVVVVKPCAWPLLNEAALEVVAKRWNFVAGPPRHYEVAIHFELTR